MKIQTKLTELLSIQFPIIMAPMFLVSNEQMMEAAIQGGIAGAFPSLNYREEGKLARVIRNCHQMVKNNPGGNFGVNIIVKSDNPLAMQHLDICIEEKVPFIITSLGDPTDVVRRVHEYGGKVFCDVTNTRHARKAAKAGCDGFIAVSAAAGGHAGPYPMHLLISSLRNEFPDVPIIAAGGVSDGTLLHGMLGMGVVGASIGTKFIATKESQVGQDYKDAIVDAKMEDIVLTRKLSGVPCTVINNDRLKEIGAELSAWEGYFFMRPKLKMKIKSILRSIGLKSLEEALFPNNYQGLFCAGQSVENISTVLGCKEVIENYKKEYESAHNQYLQQHFLI